LLFIDYSTIERQFFLDSSIARGKTITLKVDQFMPSFVPGGMGGTETYARQIFEALAVSSDISIYAILPETALDFTTEDRRREMKGVRIVDSTFGRLRGVAQVLLRARKISALLRNDAVTFVPFTAPILSRGRVGRLVVTLHDVQHRELPNLFTRAEHIYRLFTYERPARKAEHIITDSEYAKQSIVRELGIDPERITAIPLGVNTEGFTPYFGERDNFVYYPARGWAHKNHPRLIEAMKIVRRTLPDLRLVLTGGALESLAALPDWVDNKGLVPFSEVQELYRHAKVLAFPSLYEGFGFPPLEAMASGTPVAASMAASVPEICGDAAEYFDPSDPASIATGILNAIADRDRLVALGLERVKQFTWDECANRHLEVFRAVSGRNR
jgi:glycosyltransferase involved in cell wall biosynthesis